MSKSPAKKAGASAAPQFPVGHRFILEAPPFGNLSAENARLLGKYWERAQAAYDDETKLAADREKLLADGYEMTVAAVVDAGRELRDRHRDLTDRENAVVFEKWELCKILLPDFERIVVEMRDALEAEVDVALGELRTLGINSNQWGDRTKRGFVLKILPLLNEKAGLRDALHRFESVSNEVESLRVWSEIADRPVHSSTKIAWAAAENEQHALIGRLAGVDVAPVYLPIEGRAKVTPPTSPNPMDLHFLPVRKARP